MTCQPARFTPGIFGNCCTGAGATAHCCWLGAAVKSFQGKKRIWAAIGSFRSHRMRGSRATRQWPAWRFGPVNLARSGEIPGELPSDTGTDVNTRGSPSSPGTAWLIPGTSFSRGMFWPFCRLASAPASWFGLPPKYFSTAAENYF